MCVDTNTLCSYNIEKQAAEFYTREVFDRFQDIIAANTGFSLQQEQQDGNVQLFALVANDGQDPRTYRVQADDANGFYDCSCNMFDMCGLLCPHIVRVMVHLNVQLIPGRYMMERWAETATRDTPVPNANNRPRLFGNPGTNTLKYNRLCRKMNRLASDACFSDETYEFVSSTIDSAQAVVAAKRRGANLGEGEDQKQPDEVPGVQQEAVPPTGHKQPMDQGGLKNPVRQKKKGRPTEAEKRKKPLIEQREDAAKKNAKKEGETNKTAYKKKKGKSAKVKCACCWGDHHVSDCTFVEASKFGMQLSAAAKQDGLIPQGVVPQENVSTQQGIGMPPGYPMQVSQEAAALKQGIWMQPGYSMQVPSTREGAPTQQSVWIPPGYAMQYTGPREDAPTHPSIWMPCGYQMKVPGTEEGALTQPASWMPPGYHVQSSGTQKMISQFKM